MFQVEILKKAMLEERDKLRAEREHSQISEELKSRDKEIEHLEECLQLCEKDYQSKLNAQSNKWRDKLAAYQQEVEDERNSMAQAIAGEYINISLCFVSSKNYTFFLCH